MYKYHSSDFHFLIDGVYSFLKYLVCNEEAANNKRMGIQCEES